MPLGCCRMTERQSMKNCCMKPNIIVSTNYDDEEQWYDVECFNCEHLFKEGFSLSDDAYEYQKKIKGKY